MGNKPPATGRDGPANRTLIRAALASSGQGPWIEGSP